jgi:hypothetical protein
MSACIRNKLRNSLRRRTSAEAASVPAAFSPLLSCPLTSLRSVRLKGVARLLARAAAPPEPGASAPCARSRACLDRSLRSLYFPLPTRAPAGLLVQSSLSFSWGKAFAFSASDKGPLIKSGLKGTRLAIKKIRKPCALQTPFGSLDIMAFIMSPCLLADTSFLLFYGPAGIPPSVPQGTPPKNPKKKRLKEKP